MEEKGTDVSTREEGGGWEGEWKKKSSATKM